MPVRVTTSRDARGAGRARARAVARRLGVPYVRRSDIEGSVADVSTYVVGATGEWLTSPTGRRLQAHPGLWTQKVAVGPGHPLLRAVGPPGDGIRGDGLEGDGLAGLHLIDATAGLGQDALHMAAFGVTVLAVERQPTLACLLSGELRAAVRDGRGWAEAASRVRVVAGDALEVLGLMRPAATDVVFVDPMFTTPRAAAPDYDLFRLEADPAALALRLIAAALVAARRRVVVKLPAGTGPLAGQTETAADGDWFRVGFNRRITTRAFDYWIVEKSLVTPEWETSRTRSRGDRWPEPPASAAALRGGG